MRRNRWVGASVCAAALLAFGWSSAALAQKTIIVDGKPVSCADAFKFRDGPLANEFGLLFKNYDAHKEARRKAAVAELDKHIKTIEDKWRASAKEHRKRVLTRAVLFFNLLDVKFGTGLRLKDAGLSEVEKKALKALEERSENLRDAIIEGAFLKDFDAKDAILFPVSFLITVFAAPEIVLLYNVHEKADDAAKLFESATDYVLEKGDIENEIKVLRAAITKIKSVSADDQLKRINRVKNLIDKDCK